MVAISMKVVATAAALSAFFVFALSTSEAFAHSGGLNAEGCHNDRKRGGYHCHQAPSSSNNRVRQGAVTGGGFGLSSEDGRAFANCRAARAAGAAPVLIGQPGYGPHLDRDGDGIGCE
jgi:hypothetical protein